MTDHFLIIFETHFPLGKAFGKELNKTSIFRTHDDAETFQQRYKEDIALQLIHGQRVIPQKILDHGYQFQYPTLASAVPEIVNSYNTLIEHRPREVIFNNNPFINKLDGEQKKAEQDSELISKLNKIIPEDPRWLKISSFILFTLINCSLLGL